MISLKRVAAGFTIVKISYICTFLLLTPPSAFAHDFWVTVPQSENKVFTADIGYGHDFPRSEPIPEDRIHLFAPLRLVTPDDVITLDQVGENYAYQKKLDLKKGSYMVLGLCRSSFWSKGPGGWAQKDRIQRPDATIVREAILCTKTVFNIEGATDSKLITAPAGQRLEIVPMVNPSNVKVGSKFPVKVLYDGEPVKTTSVTATFAGFSDRNYQAFQGETDLKGQIDILPLKPGCWIAKTKHVLKHPDQARADEFVLVATLTFNIPAEK